MIQTFDVTTNKFYDKEGKEINPTIPELIQFLNQVNQLVNQEVTKKRPKGNVSLGSEEIK